MAMRVAEDSVEVEEGEARALALMLRARGALWVSLAQIYDSLAEIGGEGKLSQAEKIYSFYKEFEYLFSSYLGSFWSTKLWGKNEN